MARSIRRARQARALFLSYNSQDRDVVRRVREHLPADEFDIFFDADALDPGQPWILAVDQAIKQATAVVVFLSPSGLGVWQMREMAFALDRQVRTDGGPPLAVVPVLLPGYDPRDAPGLLTTNTWIDLRTKFDLDALTQGLRRAVVAGRDGADAEASPICPFKGLNAFREQDAPLFFGRGAFADRLEKIVLTQPVVAVVGPSGSGKSSVVQAGLAPRLRRRAPPERTWDIIAFKPGASPYHSLAAALVDTWSDGRSMGDKVSEAERIGGELEGGTARIEAFVGAALKAKQVDRLLIVADQFEEIFTLTPEHLRTRFIDALLQLPAATSVSLALTLRADFYSAALLTSRALSDRLQDAQVTLGVMTSDELGEAILGPAKAANLQFEAGLVQRLLKDVADEPGALPLLEFALTQLWSKRDGRMLTNKCYDDMKGVAGAVSATADRVFDGLTPERQRHAQQLFGRLVRVSPADEANTDTRRRVGLDELTAETRAVAEDFAGPEARLLVMSRNAAGEETVEVAHEALLRSWGRLRGWIASEREFLLWRQRLRARCEGWIEAGKKSGELLQGAGLKEAVGRSAARQDDLSSDERAFIDASRKRARRPLVAAVIAAAVLVVAGALGAGIEAFRRTDTYQVARVLRAGGELTATAGAGADEAWIKGLALSGRYDDALAVAGPAAPKMSDDQFEVHALVARYAIARGDVEDGVRIAKRAAAGPHAKPADLYELRRLIDALREAGETSLARSMTEAIPIPVPDTDGSLSSSELERVAYLAGHYRRTGDPARAKAIVEPWIARANSMPNPSFHGELIALGHTEEVRAAIAGAFSDGFDGRFRGSERYHISRLLGDNAIVSRIIENEYRTFSQLVLAANHQPQFTRPFDAFSTLHILSDDRLSRLESAISLANDPEVRHEYWLVVAGSIAEKRPDDTAQAFALGKAAVTQMSDPAARGDAFYNWATLAARHRRDEAAPLFEAMMAADAQAPRARPTDGDYDPLAAKAGRLAGAAQGLATLGRPDRAEAAAVEAAKAVRMVPGATRHRPEVAGALARVGRMGDAAAIAAASIGEDERLRSEAAILTGVTLRKTPGLADKLRKADL